MRLGLLLMLVARPLAARSVRSRLEARVPMAAVPQEPGGSALHSVADLAAHGFDPDSSAGLIIDAARQGLRGERLLDVSTAVLHELQRGHSRAEALAVVRRELPNVPAPPKPARASVAGARRPEAGSPP